MEYYSAIKINELLTHATSWMNFKGMLNKGRQFQKVTHLHDLIYMAFS